MGAGWPAGYKDNLIVAFHGSWNRSAPTGDKLVRIKLDRNGNGPTVRDFITGWQQPEGSRLGRPAGLIVGADGSLYVSDDTANAVYRVIPL
jgi:glucose/arabinose dehydrogenase